MGNQANGDIGQLEGMENSAEVAHGQWLDSADTPTGDIYQTTDLDWLENDDLYASEWTVKSHLKGNESAYWKITWRPIGSDGKMLTHWPDWKRFGQRVMFWYMHHPEREPLAPTSVCSYSREVRAICEWFCFERRVASVSRICKEDVDEFLSYVARQQFSLNHVTLKLSQLRRFHEWRHRIGQGLSFNPFVANRSLARVAKKLSVPPGHTPTIYPRDFFRTLNAALVMMSEADHLLECLKSYVAFRSANSQKKYRSRVYKREFGESSGELLKRCRALYGACLVVLFALWGERKHELLNSSDSGVIKFLDSDEDEIQGVEYKTSGTWTGKTTQRAAIDEVRRALSLIKELTRWTRQESNSESFFVRLPFGHSASQNPKVEVTTANLYGLFDAFVEQAGLDIKLRPHMFRRSFAMLWAWRYEIGDLEMLSKLLYHNNEVFTRFYTEDEDVWEFLPEAERELAFSIIHDALTGSRKIAGSLGNVLERYQRQLTAKFGVLSVDKTERFARKLLEEGGYRVIANADGYCFINEARGHRAKCSTDGSTPNYANRSEELCVQCPNFGAGDSRVDYWETRRNAHQEVLEKTSIPMLADSAKKGVARAEKIIRHIKVKQLD